MSLNESEMLNMVQNALKVIENPASLSLCPRVVEKDGIGYVYTDRDNKNYFAVLSYSELSERGICMVFGNEQNGQKHFRVGKKEHQDLFNHLDMKYADESVPFLGVDTSYFGRMEKALITINYHAQLRMNKYNNGINELTNLKSCFDLLEEKQEQLTLVSSRSSR